MSKYYNSAALLGGWATPATAFDVNNLVPWAETALNEITAEGFDQILTYVKKHYPAAAPDLAGIAIALAFALDTSLMNGDVDLQYQVIDYINNSPDPDAYRKTVKYARKVIHTGGSKLTDVERTNMRIAAMKSKAARRAYLQQSKWWGSDPFVDGERVGSYKYLYAPRPRPVTSVKQQLARDARLRRLNKLKKLAETSPIKGWDKLVPSARLAVLPEPPASFPVNAPPPVEMDIGPLESQLVQTRSRLRPLPVDLQRAVMPTFRRARTLEPAPTTVLVQE